MTTLKETLEAGESAVSQGTNRPKAESGHLRSDAVSLDVPIKVHGSRVIEVVRGTTPHTEPFEEQTTTMIVFPQGGVLRMSTIVSAGQAVVLTNLKTRQDAICRVVKVRTNPNMHSYVEIEFTHPQPGYWGVHFASDGPAPARKAAPAPPPAASVAAAPVALPVAPPVAPKTEVAAKDKMVFEAPAFPSPTLSLGELRGDAPSVPESSSSGAGVAEEAQELEIGSQAIEETPAGKDSAKFGRFAASSSLGAPRAVSREFGSRLEYGTLGAASQAAETGQGEGRNWFLIAASVLLFAAVGGGAYYFYARPATRLAISAPPAPELPVQTSAVENPVSAPPPASDSASRQASAPSSAPAVTVHTTEAPPSRPVKAAPSENKPSAPKKEKAPGAAPAVPDMFGALNAHPVSSGRAAEVSREAAPSIDPGMATGNETGALPAVAAPSANLVPPVQPAPEGPIPVGGDVKPPKLISSVPPVYPSIARQANVQGSVVVRIIIDKAGKVSEAHVISGSALLRQAAVDALRQRKYEVSTLNGQPVSVEILVTIQFHR